MLRPPGRGMARGPRDGTTARGVLVRKPRAEEGLGAAAPRRSAAAAADAARERQALAPQRRRRRRRGARQRRAAAPRAARAPLAAGRAGERRRGQRTALRLPFRAAAGRRHEVHLAVTGLLVTAILFPLAGRALRARAWSEAFLLGIGAVGTLLFLLPFRIGFAAAGVMA